MKHLYVLMLSMMAITVNSFELQAQVMNYTYTDCNSATESVYDLFAQGKPVLIASKGFDCSICMSQADEVQDFAEQHPEIRVWGAMNYKYSTTIPTCTAVNNWKSTYNWNDIFMFPDVNDDWQGLGYPTYYVLNPADSLISYQGSNFNMAKTFALNAVPDTATGISNPESIFKVGINQSSRTIELSCFEECNGEFSIMLANLLGQTVIQQDVYFSREKISIPLKNVFSRGIYLLLINNKKGKTYAKKIHLN